MNTYPAQEPQETALKDFTLGGGVSNVAERVPLYSYYALAVLTASCILNYVDRQIVSILAQSIKVDLVISDAQLGFLLGTAFAVFYAVLGIAMGRIADVMSRSHLMAGGLALWSAMTALGGATTNFTGLSATRIGVGVGEASANPCSHSLLCDYFPPRHRAAAFGTYLAGVYGGSALALILGGLIVQHWSGLCRAVPITGACSLAAWKAALLIVGLPGLPLALLVARLRETAGRAPPPRPMGRIVARELGAAVPPFTIFTLYQLGRRQALVSNLKLAAGVVAGAALLTLLVGDVAQWVAVGLGAYSVASWAQVQRLNDKPLFALTFGCRTFMMVIVSAALVAAMMSAVTAWAAPYAMRTLGTSAAWTGVSIGLTFGIAGGMGAIIGGWLTDRWKVRNGGAPIWVALIGMLAALPCLLVMLNTSHPAVYVGAYFAYIMFGTAWSGAYAALVQDLVLQRMRGTAAATVSLVSIVVSAAVGPYVVGKVSTLTGSLSTGLLGIQALLPVTITLLVLTGLRLRRAGTQGASRMRAASAGEPGLDHDAH